MATPYSTSIPPGPQSEFRSLEVRVCDLHVLTSPTGASDYFTVDGLYVVLRFGAQVRRTACLWESEPQDDLDGGVPDEAPGQFLSFEDTTWNELFVLTLDSDELEAARKGPEAQGFPSIAPSPSGFLPAPTSILGGIATSPSPSMPGQPLRPAELRSTPPSLRTPTSARGGPQPTIEVELWRSTTEEESHIGWFRFALPSEFGAAMASKTVLKNGVLDKVVPLQNASAFDHRLGVRLRVRPFGVTFVPSTTPATASAGVLGHSGRVPLYPGLYGHPSTASSSTTTPTSAAGLLGYASSGTGPTSILSRPPIPGVATATAAGPASIYPVPATAAAAGVGVLGGTTSALYGTSDGTGSSGRGVLGVGNAGLQRGLVSQTLSTSPHLAAGTSGGSSPALAGDTSGGAPLFDAQQMNLQLPTSTGSLFPSAPPTAAGSVLPTPNSTTGAIFDRPAS